VIQIQPLPEYEPPTEEQLAADARRQADGALTADQAGDPEPDGAEIR
jgi:hypothetical protein